MPRNGSGTMSVPNSFTSGTTISSSSVNANFTDIASEITGSLPRDGQAAMTGQFKAANGSTSAPSLSFSSDTNTGFYRKAADEIGVVVGGTEVGAFTSKGLDGIAGTPTGAMMMYGATTAPDGWVRCNGRTIGNASSSGTERANADTEDLFTFLWTNYSDSVCAVSSGRGASAAADFAANKRIALPDLRGRAFFGLDDMGNSAASRLGTIITGQTTNGSSGGTETVTLTEAQLPSHTHTASVTDTGHTHPLNNDVGVTGSGAGSSGAAFNSGTLPTFGNGESTSWGTTSNATTGISVSNSATGSGSAHSNMPPAFLTTFIIKL